VPVEPVEPALTFELLPLFQAKAPPETAAALKGREDVSLAVLIVQGTNPEVFRSAKADLRDEYQPLIAAIAQVIVENAEVIGRITVVGHTDSVPVQASNPFQSNQGPPRPAPPPSPNFWSPPGCPPTRSCRKAAPIPNRWATTPPKRAGRRTGGSRSRSRRGFRRCASSRPSSAFSFRASCGSSSASCFCAR
jgi:hypothetical protein